MKQLFLFLQLNLLLVIKLKSQLKQDYLLSRLFVIRLL